LNEIISIGLLISFVSILMTTIAWIENGVTEVVSRAIYASGTILLIVLLTITITYLFSNERNDWNDYH